MTEFWIIVWKAVFFLGFGLFSVMAVWVAVAGGRDVKRLLARLRQKQDSGSQ